MAGKFYKGNRPNAVDLINWNLVKIFNDGKNDFEIWEQKFFNESGWKQVKVCAVKKFRNKANYWLSTNGERWSNCKNLGVMFNINKNLYNELLKIYKVDLKHE